MRDSSTNAKIKRNERTAGLQPVCRLTLLLTIGLVVAIPKPTRAATINVTSTADPVATSGNGVCTLREAINNANSPGTDTTGKDCEVGSGTDTINFTVGGKITLTNSGTCYPVTNFFICVSLPAISNNLTIDGTDKGVTIDGNHFEPLLVLHGATLTVNNLTITDGSGQANGPSGAGAIGSYGTLNVNNSTFTEDQGAAGAILSQGSLAVTNSTFTNNPVYAIETSGPPSAYYTGVPLPESVTNSTFVSNGVALGVGQPLSVTNSTIYGNLGVGGNAAIYLAWYVGGVLTISNSILASNSVGNCSQNSRPPSAIVNGGYNIEDDTSCGFGSSSGANGQTLGDQVDASLANALGDNGGPTQTLALLQPSPPPTNPAIDAIPLNLCPATDQRGFIRPDSEDSNAASPACDVGAFEFGASASNFCPPFVGNSSVSGSMEGNLAINPGDTIMAGYDFTIPGSHPADTVTAISGTVTLPVSCPDNSTVMLTINLPKQSYTVSQNDSSWLPSGDQKSSLVYQGSTIAPATLCGGNQGHAPKGASFAEMFGTTTSTKFNVRFHYSDNSAGGWSGTKSVQPSSSSACF